MFAIFRLLSAVSAVFAFIQSPTGQRLIGQVRTFITRRSQRGTVAEHTALPSGTPDR